MSELKGISKYKEELIKNARYMVQKGKGILASDESTGTIGKRLATINVENTEENRRHYRELLYTCPELEKYISGAILYDETVYQKTKEGKRFTELLTSRGILPGIKVDKGTIPIINSENETLTQGLDDLGKRCAKYYEEGCRFAKWRSVLRITKNTPSENAIIENASGLDEERWNPAFWNYDIQQTVIGYEQANPMADALINWYNETGVENIGLEDNDSIFDSNMMYIGKGPNGLAELCQNACLPGDKQGLYLNEEYIDYFCGEAGGAGADISADTEGSGFGG